MPSPHRPSAGFADHLRALYAAFPFERSLAQDPLSCVRPYGGDRGQAEVAGLVAAVLAIGNTTAIRRAFADVERRVDGDFVGWVERSGRASTAASLATFRHRWVRGDQLTHLAREIDAARRTGGSIEELFLDGYRAGGFDRGLDAMSRALRRPLAGAPTPRGYDRMFPTPLAASHSPCKRLTLYTRWMVRPAYPDLGLWPHVPTGELRVPLDQHVYWIAYHLGLTARRTRSWATVEEVTASLRGIEPVDPVKFDFVLCHTGISGDCPKRRDITICGPCLVRPDCRMWRGRVAA